MAGNGYEQESTKGRVSATQIRPEESGASINPKEQLAASDNSNVDAAWEFLQKHRDLVLHNVSLADMAALRRKIDWHIVPLMFCCYTMQFLDKVILNYAAVMGLKQDLNLTGNDFSNVATFLFVALLLFEIPNTYLIQRFPVGKWLGANVALWGVATACGAAAHDYRTLLVSRVFLGIFEATIGPSLILISSQWYTKSEQALRFSFWYLGLGLGQIIGGAVSYGFQQVNSELSTVSRPENLAGWRIMFIMLGCVTILVGLCTALFLPDSPIVASWLNEVEKVTLLRHISTNRTGVDNRQRFYPFQILEALRDPQVYLLVLSVVLLSTSSGVVTTFSSTLISNLGYDAPHAALMNIPSGVVSIFFTLLVGFGIRKRSQRWAWIIVCIIPGIIGGGLMSFMPKSNPSGILAGIYLVNAVVAPLPVFYSLIAANIAGPTKRAFAASMISGSFSLGNVIGPQTFQARDAPDYHPAKVTVLVTQAACAMTTLVLFLHYHRENRRCGSDEVDPNQEDSSLSMQPETWTGLTDRENRRFLYSY